MVLLGSQEVAMIDRARDTLAFYEEMLERILTRRRELREQVERVKAEDGALGASEDHVRGKIADLRRKEKSRGQKEEERPPASPPKAGEVEPVTGGSPYVDQLLSTTVWVDRIAITLLFFGPMTEKEIYDHIVKHAPEVNKNTISSSLQKLKSKGYADASSDHKWTLEWNPKIDGPWPGWRVAQKTPKPKKKAAHGGS
jgi:hypothetical protein